MDNNFINEYNSRLSSNEINYSQEQVTFPLSFTESSQNNAYPSPISSDNNEINDLNIPLYNNNSTPIESYQNNFTTQPYTDSSNTYDITNKTEDDDFAIVVKIYDENSQNAETYQNEVSNFTSSDNIEYNTNTNDNFIDTNNIIETTGYQTSYQQNEYTNNFNNSNIINENITEYPVENTQIDYNTTSNSVNYNYNINSTPVEYNTNINEVTNEYNNTNNYYETNNNIDIGNTNYYSIQSVPNDIIPDIKNSFQNSNLQFNSLNYSDNYSKYNSNSVPIDITPQFNEDDDTEIIPVEEIEYIPVKRTKYIKTKKVKIPPKKKTVIIPKKVVIPIPVKKIVYVQKKQKPKVIPSLTKVTKIPNVITPQIQKPKLPVRKNLGFVVNAPNYAPKIYRIEL